LKDTLVLWQVVVGIIMTNMRLKTGLAFHTKEQMVWPATKDAFDFMPTPYVQTKLSLDSIQGTPLKVGRHASAGPARITPSDSLKTAAMTATTASDAVLGHMQIDTCTAG
jgi:hypothetical protein